MSLAGLRCDVMTDDDELEALLARQADEVRQFVARTRAADPQALPPLAGRLSAALDLGMADVIAAVRTLGLSGTAVNVSQTGVLTGNGFGTAVSVSQAAWDTFASSGVVTGTGILALGKRGVVPARDIGALADRAQKDGLASLSKQHAFVLVLVLLAILVAAGIIIEPELPPGVKNDLGTDTGITGMALAIAVPIVMAMVSNSRKD
jgi:hypothetical protein